MKFVLSILFSACFILPTLAANETSGSEMSSSHSAIVETQKSAGLQIAGRVFDKASSEALAGAVVYIDNKKVYTDLDGNFILKGLTPGTHLIKAELISYESKEIKLDAQNDDKISIALAQK